MVVFTTDKSAKLTVDSVANYMEALDKHSGDDVIIEDAKVKDIEKNMNQHLSQFNRMFNVGSTWGQTERISGSSTGTNIPPPPKYCLRKDHKAIPAGQERYGHPTRPIVGASEAPNS